MTRASRRSVVCVGVAILAGPASAGAAPPSEQATEAAAEPATQREDADGDPALSLYLTHMRAAGLLDNTEATLKELEGMLQAAQDRHVAGDPLGSAVLLFELSHNPRYSSFHGLPVMSSVQYHLGVALESYGAELSALEAFRNVLAAGTDDPYFRPALRRHVDLALASKDFPRGLAELDASLGAGKVDVAALDPIDASEHHYLRGRALQGQGDVPGALAALSDVDVRSRFSTAALYLAGLMHAGRGNYRKAEAAFCAVVGGERNSTAVYYVDSRYFPVRDLAQLGLGRVAHEERRHGHAFYHYFQIPEESEQLPAALYEAAWTMAEEGEHGVARGLVKDLRERFPNSPQSAEARLLDAMLALYDCDFREAEAMFERFVVELAPVADHIDEIRKDPARIRALHEQMLRLRTIDRELSAEPPSYRLLLAMLDEDPTYSRISHQAAVLRREARFASALDLELERVRARLLGEKTTVARRSGGDALDAIAGARELERAIAGLETQIREAEAAGADPAQLAPDREAIARLRARVRILAGEAEALARRAPRPGRARTTELVGVVDEDRARIQALRAHALGLAARLDDGAAAYAGRRLVRLRARIDDLMGEARMGRIDAVLGAKKKLEIEVQSMAAGRFPSELFGKLQIEGMVGDDEEYWPYEGEYWADEYEDYR